MHNSSFAAAALCPSIYKHGLLLLLLLLLLLRGDTKAVCWIERKCSSKTLSPLLYVQPLAALSFRHSSNQHARLQQQHHSSSSSSSSSSNSSSKS